MRDNDDRSTAPFRRWLSAIEQATAWSRVDTTDRTEDETGTSDGDTTLQDDTRESQEPPVSTPDSDLWEPERTPESALEQGCDCEPGRAEVRFEHPHGGLLLVRQAGPCAAVAGHAHLYFALPGHIADESELLNPLRDAYQRIVAARDSPAVAGVSRPPPVATTTVDTELSDARYRRLAATMATVAVDTRRLHARLHHAITTFAADDDAGGGTEGGERP